MRILYENEIDDLTSGSIIASTEDTSYPAINIQDQRLTTPWKTTSATDQTILFNAGGAEQPMFQATTNLIVDPEDMTSANWTNDNSTDATAGTINGIPAFAITATATSSSYIRQTTGIISTATSISLLVTIRKGTQTSTRVVIYNASAASTLAGANITFASKAIEVTEGTKTVERWIDDDTLILGLTGDVATVGNVIRPFFYAGPITGATTSATVIYSAPILTATPYPLEYTATTRAAWATTYPFRMPPSGKFIVDTVIRPYGGVLSSIYNRFLSWYISSTRRLRIMWNTTGLTNRISVNYHNSGTESWLISNVFDYGTTQTAWQNIRLIASLDLSTGGVSTGSRFIIIPFEQGDIYENTTWSSNIDDFTNPEDFTTLQLGKEQNVMGDCLMKYCRVYGGLLENTITTEQDVDDELKTKDLLFDQTYQNQFDINSLAILGHTITQGASIKAELNDWNEWNYTDGSGSSIIQETLTWNEETILKFLSSKVKRQYAKFTINDPNNEDEIISIARMWIGEYETIDPSSLLDFRVRKKRSDVVIYGRNRQKFSNPGVGWREFQLSFPPTSTTTLSIIQDLYDTVGNHSSIIFCNFDSIRNYAIVEPCYCSINGDLEFTHDRHMKFRYDLNLEEDK